MKKTMILLAINVCSIALSAQQTDTSRSTGINGLFKKANSVLNKSKSATGNALSSEDIVAGLKEALSLGAENSSARLSRTDGFLKDAAVKILMPEEVRKLETRMRALGMGSIVDDATTRINRAAEDASKTAGPIFINAIKKMSIQDALGILRGTDTAATSYLKRTTSNDLTNSFRPVIDSALKRSDATRYWKEVFTVYNRFSATPITADINEYVTERALRGIFYYVGEEEKKIRTNPAARVNDILKKVFGSK